MLRVNKLIDYGTLILAHMAQSPERVFSAAELATTLGLGQAVVRKILKILGQHDLLTSSRGARGGYVLARPAHQINLAQVVDALEDQPFGLTECTAAPGTCRLEPDCHLRMGWQRVTHMMRRTLEGVSIADMKRPACAAPARSTATFSPFPHWSLQTA